MNEGRGQGAKQAEAVSADAVLARLNRCPSEAAIAQGRALLVSLRDQRDFERLVALCEALERLVPGDPTTRKFYAQGLIDTGRSSLALVLLRDSLLGKSPGDPGFDELTGLVGRGHKQVFMDAVDTTTDVARQAIRDSVEAYRGPFHRDPSNYWHGINLCAVLFAARRRGVEFVDLDVPTVAGSVLASLDAVPSQSRDVWWNGTRAEAYIALGKMTEAEEALHEYVCDRRVQPFQIAGTLRQFRDLWEIQKDSDGMAGLIQLLEAHLSEKESVLNLHSDHALEMRKAAQPTRDQRERVLGQTGARSIHWYRLGLDRAASVCAVRYRGGGERFGTGFAVSAEYFGLGEVDELFVLTNFHVLNAEGRDDAEVPGGVELDFEMIEGEGRGPYFAEEIVAESPAEELDYALLRVRGGLRGIEPVPISSRLPDLQEASRVYVIGHPQRKELHISLQDNRLLDHEGPPNGKPPYERCRRVHYHAPTERGSSGSPVFDSTWRLIALHRGGQVRDLLRSFYGMQMLNGKSGRYSANEGVWIESIRSDVAD